MFCINIIEDYKNPKHITDKDTLKNSNRKHEKKWTQQQQIKP